MAPRETENNAYAKFGGDEQRTLWYVIVFSGVVNCKELSLAGRDNSTTNFNAVPPLTV